MTDTFNPQVPEDNSQVESQESAAKRRRTKDYKALDDLFNQAVKKSRNKRITTYASKKQHTLKSEQTSSFVSTPRKVEALTTGEIDTELVKINLNKKMTVNEWRANELEKNFHQDSPIQEGEESNTDVLPAIPKENKSALASLKTSKKGGEEPSIKEPSVSETPVQKVDETPADEPEKEIKEIEKKENETGKEDAYPRPSDDNRPEFIGFEDKEQSLIEDFFKNLEETPKKEKPVSAYKPPKSFDLGLIPERPFEEDELMEADVETADKEKTGSSGLNDEEIESLLDFFTAQGKEKKKKSDDATQVISLSRDEKNLGERGDENDTTFIEPKEKEGEESRTVFIDDKCNTKNLEELLSDIQLNLENCSGDDWSFGEVAEEVKEEVEDRPDDEVDDTKSYLIDQKMVEKAQSESQPSLKDQAPKSDEARFEDFLIEEFDATTPDLPFTPSPLAQEATFKNESSLAFDNQAASEEKTKAQERKEGEQSNPTIEYHDLSFAEEGAPASKKADRQARMSQLKEKLSKEKKSQEENHKIADRAKEVYKSERAQNPNPYQGTFSHILRHDPALKNALIGFSVSLILFLAFLLFFGRELSAAGWIMAGILAVSIILTHELKQLQVYFLIIADLLVYLFMMVYMVYSVNYQITLPDYLWFILIPLCLMTAFAFFNNYSCWRQDRLHYVRNDRFENMDDNKTAAEKIDRLTGQLPDLSDMFPEEESQEKTVPLSLEDIHEAMAQDQPLTFENGFEDLEFNPEEWLQIDLEEESERGEDPGSLEGDQENEKTAPQELLQERETQSGPVGETPESFKIRIEDQDVFLPASAEDSDDSSSDVNLDHIDPENLQAIMDHLDHLDEEKRKQQQYKSFFEDHVDL